MDTKPGGRSGRHSEREPYDSPTYLIRRVGSLLELKYHPGNTRQHQGRPTGAVRAGLGLLCQGYRPPLQLEKETAGVV
jgi:hypothetical protein